MKTVGVYEAKTHLPELLKQVEQGECITITRHGKPIARIEPVRPAGRTAEEIAEILAEARALRQKHSLVGLSIRELIDDGRRY